MTVRALVLLLAGSLIACSNTGTQSADAKGQPPQASGPEAAAQPGAAAPAERNQIYVQPQSNQPPPTVSAEQAEKACAGAAVRAARKEESNLFITLSICRKFVEMFPDNKALKDATTSLEKSAVEQGADTAASLNKAATPAPTPAPAPSTAPAK